MSSSDPRLTSQVTILPEPSMGDVGLAMAHCGFVAKDNHRLVLGRNETATWIVRSDNIGLSYPLSEQEAEDTVAGRK